MTKRKISILICDDHELIREGLKHILLDSAIAIRVGEAANQPEAIAAARRENWDLVVLDINLGGRNGLDVLKDLKGEHPSLPVLVLSMYPEDQYAVPVIRAGASGYVNKNRASSELVEAIDRVLVGGQYISPKVAEQLFNAVRQPQELPLHATLSPREDQVLRLIAAGRAVGEIAGKLSLSVKTVSTYRANVLRKLFLSNNAQLMRYAHEHGLGE